MSVQDEAPGPRRYSDETANHVQVDRLARYIWSCESSDEAEWNRKLDTYRWCAKRILTTPDGWKTT